MWASHGLQAMKVSHLRSRSQTFSIIPHFSLPSSALVGWPSSVFHHTQPNSSIIITFGDMWPLIKLLSFQHARVEFEFWNNFVCKQVESCCLSSGCRVLQSCCYRADCVAWPRMTCFREKSHNEHGKKERDLFHSDSFSRMSDGILKMKMWHEFA